MSSITQCIYPRLTWKQGEKRLWNPIHRKSLKNLPEERVRLRTVEYLLQSGWSKHRISTEEPVAGIKENALRTDLICYSQEFKPRLLVECKAGHVPISAKTAEQAARYNQRVEAPYLLLTNGWVDFWYAIAESNEITELQQPPTELNLRYRPPEFRFQDWIDRGFAGEHASPELRKWIGQLLPQVWLDTHEDAVRFFNFTPSPTDISLNHYYRIRPVFEDSRIALTFLGTPTGENRLIGILNRQGSNKALLEINLGPLFKGEEENSSLYSTSGTVNFSLKRYWDLPGTASVDHLFELLVGLFEEFLS